MKKLAIFLICALFLLSDVLAQETVTPPGPHPAPPSGGLSGPVTPENIKSFLSKQKEQNYIILNFDNADLKDVINTVASITNENFILSPGIDARITIHSSKKIPVSEVMNVFESVLEVNGISLVKSGEFFKLIPGTAAKQKPLEVRKGFRSDEIPDVDRIVTQIVPVQYVPATEISTVLTPMLSQFGSITPNPRNNLLIINDLSSNIGRLMDVMKEIDVNVFKNTRMFFFKPTYSDVITLTNELTEVLNALNLAGEGLAVIPIERINSLVVFSSSSTLLKAVEGWIKKLDEEVVTGQNTYVYPIQNVKAQDIAEILKALYEVTDSGRPQATALRKQAAADKAKARRPVSRIRQLQKGEGSRVEILTFEPTNSLVILAPPGIYREIVQTIKRIDVYPREVLIEAVIAEVSLSDADEYGVQWSVLHNLNIENKDFTGLAEARFSDPAPNLLTSAPTLVGGAGGLSYVLFRPEKLTAIIRALAGESRVNILSSPRLLVRDQEEASIEVGSEIPTATSTTSTTTTDTLTQNIEYRTVGIKLKIKPTISEERTVVLDLEQEVSTKGEDQQVGREGNRFPSFDTTKTKSSIVVPDKQGIIIGGIIEEEKDRAYQGIPFLSKLPILGPLFRYNNRSLVKKELVILITPYVISNRDEADVLTRQFLGRLRELKDYLVEIGQEKELNIPIINEKKQKLINIQETPRKQNSRP